MIFPICGFDAKNAVLCPQCEGKVRRIISGGSGMIFKGTGFYLTDYGKSGTSKKTESAPTKSTTKEDSHNE